MEYTGLKGHPFFKDYNQIFTKTIKIFQNEIFIQLIGHLICPINLIYRVKGAIMSVNK